MLKIYILPIFYHFYNFQVISVQQSGSKGKNHIIFLLREFFLAIQSLILSQYDFVLNLIKQKHLRQHANITEGHCCILQTNRKCVVTSYQWKKPNLQQMTTDAMLNLLFKHCVTSFLNL